METILFIDTSSNKEIVVGLRSNGKKFEKELKIDQNKAQVTLPMIDKIFKEHNVELSEITSVRVKTGPGSFTGVRVGISIANALSFVLKVPINEKKHGELAEPTYE